MDAEKKVRALEVLLGIGIVVVILGGVSLLGIGPSSDSFTVGGENYTTYEHEEMTVDYHNQVERRYAERLAQYMAANQSRENKTTGYLRINRPDEKRYEVKMTTVYGADRNIPSSVDFQLQLFADELSAEVFDGETVVLRVTGPDLNGRKTYVSG